VGRVYDQRAINCMNKDNKKNIKLAQRRSASFYKQFQKLKAKFPEIMVCGDIDGDVIAITNIDCYNRITTYLNK
jgi:hypothetical protein